MFLRVILGWFGSLALLSAVAAAGYLPTFSSAEAEKLVVIGSVSLIGAFVGGVVELNRRVNAERKKYEKLSEFLERFVTPEDWQGMVERLLQNKAGLCADSSRRVVDFQQMKRTVNGIADVEHLRDEYFGEQETFRALQKAFCDLYNIAKPFGAMLGFKLRGRKLEEYTTISAVVLP